MVTPCVQDPSGSRRVFLRLFGAKRDSGLHLAALRAGVAFPRGAMGPELSLFLPVLG